MRPSRAAMLWLPVMLCLTGCMNDLWEQAETPPEKKKESLLKRKTQDIAKYDPDAGRVIRENDVQMTNPVTGPLEAYGPMVGQISDTVVQQHVTAYYAEHGRWPTYEEFMSDIIKRYNVQLPVQPAKGEYQYDEENHRLLVVEPLEAEGDAGPEAETE